MNAIDVFSHIIPQYFESKKEFEDDNLIPIFVKSNQIRIGDLQYGSIPEYELLNKKDCPRKLDKLCSRCEYFCSVMSMNGLFVPGGHYQGYCFPLDENEKINSKIQINLTTNKK